MINGFKLNIPTIKRFIYNIQSTTKTSDKLMCEIYESYTSKVWLSSMKIPYMNIKDVLPYIYTINNSYPIKPRGYGYTNVIGSNCYYDAVLIILANIPYFTNILNLILSFDTTNIDFVENVDLSLLSLSFIQHVSNLNINDVIKEKEKWYISIETLASIRKLTIMTKLFSYYQICNEDINIFTELMFEDSKDVLASLTSLINELKNSHFDEGFMLNNDANKVMELIHTCKMNKVEKFNAVEYKTLVPDFDRVSKERNVDISMLYMKAFIFNALKKNKSEINISKSIVKYRFLYEYFRLIVDLHDKLSRGIPTNEGFVLPTIPKKEDIKQLNLFEKFDVKLKNLFRVLTTYKKNSTDHTNIICGDGDKDRCKINIGYGVQNDASGVLISFINLTQAFNFSPYVLINTITDANFIKSNIKDSLAEYSTFVEDTMTSIHDEYSIIYYKPVCFICRTPPRSIIYNIPDKDYVKNYSKITNIDQITINNKLSYSLMSVLYRPYGNSTGGHYIAYIKHSKNGAIYEYNDSVMNETKFTTFSELFANEHSFGTDYTNSFLYDYIDEPQNEEFDFNDLKTKTVKFEYPINGYSTRVIAYTYIRDDYL